MAHGTDRGGQPPGALGPGGNLQPSAQKDYRQQLRCADRARPPDAIRKTESALTRSLAADCMKTAGIIGGGLAGLAAGCALADAGFRVTLYERRPYVGGRASSYEHPGTGEVVDNCQHVLLGCCTNLVHFYGQLGVDELIEWFGALTFIEP